MMQHKIKFWPGFNGFEFRVILLWERLRTMVESPTSWKEKNLIYTFPKGISAMRNASCHVQGLNSGRRVDFLG